MADERLVKTEFHLHTAETSQCAVATAGEIIPVCAAKGYGCVIITDHYTPGRFERPETRHLFLNGFHAAQQAAEPLGLTVLPAMEIRFDRGMEDFLVYGMEEADFAKLPPDLCRFPLADFHAYCGGHGYLFCQAHPYRPGLTAQDPAHLDGVEVHNGHPRHNSHNDRALAFAREHHLLMIAGGDVHQISDVSGRGILVPETLLTPKGIVQFLRAHPQIGTQLTA